MKDKYDLIIFDCDGTLVDSEVLNNQACSEILLELGLKEYTREACLNFFEGRSWNEMLPELKGKHGNIIPDDIIERYVARVKEAIPHHVKIVEGVFESLGDISQNYSICVVSNGERENVITEIQVTSLNQFFKESQIFTKSQVKNAKPAPDLFLFAAEKMGVEPARCLVIEDSPTGAQAGVAAGMDVWGFTGVSHDKEESVKALTKVGVFHIFDDFIHIGDALKL